MATVSIPSLIAVATRNRRVGALPLVAVLLYSLEPGKSQPPRKMVTPCKRCSLSLWGEHMDGSTLELPLFLIATFAGAFVAGLSGFASGLVAASL